jgi:ribosomal protein S27E
MNLKIAKEICDRQGIVMHVEVPVICPRCKKKAMILDLTDNNTHCLVCGKNYKSVEELHILENERWRRRHSKTIKEMEAKSGVKQ